jgi:hypothetical protein
MKHNDSDIISALKCHATGDCLSCPYFGVMDCVGVVCSAAAEKLCDTKAGEDASGRN